MTGKEPTKKVKESPAPAEKAPKAKASKAAAPTKKEAAKEKAAPVKAPAQKTGATIMVVQTGSPIGREESQRATLIGLGLNKLHRVSQLEDTPAVRGMITKVRHLVRVESAEPRGRKESGQ